MIENAKITNIALHFQDYSLLTLDICLEGNGWGCVYGNRVLGKAYVGRKEQDFTASDKGLIAIMRIMDLLEINDLYEAKGKYVRCEIEGGWGGTVTKIGNIVKDKWFRYEDIFMEVNDDKS